MIIENIKTEELKDFENNPRTIKPSELEKLKKSLEKFGFVDPLIIDEDNNVIGGNQRLKAAKELKISLIPCNRLVGLKNAEKKALNIALNKISGEWDDVLLNKLLSEIKTADAELLLQTGFEEKELFKRLLKSDDFVEDVVDVNAYERAKNKNKVNNE